MAEYRKKPVVPFSKTKPEEYDVKNDDVLEFPNGAIFNLNCCDCGLSHLTSVRISPISLGQKIRISFVRNSIRSLINRNNKKYPCEPVGEQIMADVEKWKEMKDNIQEVVTKAATFCADCNPGRGVLFCKSTSCIGKKLYGLLIECLCLFDKEK